MAAPTPPTTRQRYVLLRRGGYSKAEAARLAGISYRTAFRIDRPGSCRFCGAQHDTRHRR
jgi:hypothetical protein